MLAVQKIDQAWNADNGAGCAGANQSDDAVVLDGIKELVYLDRYAMKDIVKEYAPGDTVIVLVKDDPRFPQKEVGTVRSINDDDVTVELKSTGELFTQNRKHIDKPLEVTPADMWDRMAKAIVAVEADERKAELQQSFRWLLGGFRFSPGGRINAMLGTGQNLTAYNCYVVPMRPNNGGGVDSRQAIIDTLGNMVEIMSRGGGVGINLSSLRPRLSYVSGVNGRSSGSVSWGALFSFATGLVEQGGSRRGALMLILEDWHPDLAEFIKAKRDMQAINNANISVGISHAFMKAVAEDADWDLVFPDTKDPDYDTMWDGKITRWRDELHKPVVVHRTLKAREVWNTIMESAWMSAEPGVVFLERMNEYSNSWYFEDLISTNPCVTGETLIYTGDGLKRADDLYFKSTPLQVVADSRLTPEPFLAASRVFATGIKPVYKLTTKEGFSLRLTGNHKLLTLDRGWVQAEELQIGDELLVQNRGGCFGTEGSADLGKLLGWIVGDGTLKSDRAVLSFFGAEKQELATSFAAAAKRSVRAAINGRDYSISVVEVEDRDEARVQSARLLEIAQEYGLAKNKLAVPDAVFSGSRELQQGFLQALYTADGHVEMQNGSRSAIVLTSISESLLQAVQRLLLNFGIYSRVYMNRHASGLTLLPDGKGGAHEYETSARHDLRITRSSMVRFYEQIGFLTASKQQKLGAVIDRFQRGPYKEKFVATFTGLQPDGEEMVFDLTVPSTHAFCGNGLVIHNCAEQPLPAWGVCNLGHINLSRFAKGHIGQAEVDWDALRQAVHLGVRFLDNVIDITPYFFSQNEKLQKKERRIGMGTMGLGEMLVRLGIRYGSQESLDFIDRIYSFIADEAYVASAQLAAEKGSFPAFSATKYLEGKFVKGLPEQARQAIAEHGMRNVCVLTQAPTGSTGTMIGTSTGIEPYYSWTYFRKGRLGVKEVHESIVQEYFAENPHIENNLSNLPPYFVTAMELEPREHIKVQAAIQRWTDSSISKTANAPNHYTVDQTRELYEFAYQSGCKGVTIYRDGSRDEQVLTKKEEEPAAAPPAESVPTTTTTTTQLPLGLSPEDTGVQQWHGRPQKLTGATYEWTTPLGKAFITVNEYSGEPKEIFINIGKAGTDIAAMSEALGRLATMFLKHAGLPSSEDKVHMLVKHLSDIGGSTSVGFGANRIASVPDALAKTLKCHVEDSNRNRGIEVTIRSGVGMDICPTCGQAALAREEGCFVCKACGYSKC